MSLLKFLRRSVIAPTPRLRNRSWQRSFSNNVQILECRALLSANPIGTLSVQSGSTTLVNGFSTVDFGSTVPGNAITRVITLTNSSIAPLSLTSIGLPTDYAITSGFTSAGITIAAGASINLTLQMNAGQAGVAAGLVTVYGTAASLFSFNVIAAIVPSPTVSQGSTKLVNGVSTVNLGTVPVGTPASQMITITNVAPNTLIMQPVSVTAGFSVVNNFTVNQQIAVGASASFLIRLDATAGGNKNGTVTLTGNGSTNPLFRFQVSGVVATAANIPILAVQNGTTFLTNGSGRIGFNITNPSQAVSKVVTVANHGNAPLIVQPVTAPAGFAIVNNFVANQSIAPGSSADLIVQLTANAIGTPAGILTITSNDPTAGPFNLNLVGNHAPMSITLSNNVVVVNSSSPTLLGTLVTTDLDPSPQTISYSVSGPTFMAGNSAVSIFFVDGTGSGGGVAAGVLEAAANAPVGAYTVSVTATDQDGLSLTLQIPIFLTSPSLIGIPSYGLVLPSISIADPHPEQSNEFGASKTVLPSGNIVITAPNDDAGGGSAANATGAGAVYLFNGQTGSLISTLTGSHAGDHIGANGVIDLGNGNFVIDSSNWNSGVGAVTYGNGVTGVQGIVGVANSLTGSTAGDQVGDRGVTVLNSGNYVVNSPDWNGGTGAATWASGTVGVHGTISAANSLVGLHPGDAVGSGGIAVLTNDNYVVDSPAWDNGPITNAGAVTWGSGQFGVQGAISSINSLVGTHANDAVGSNGITTLNNGNYVVDSPQWSGPVAVAVGAVTWGNGTRGADGAVSPSNSLIGSSSNDAIGSGGIIPLANSDYVAASPNYNGNAGAATWFNPSLGVSGVVSSANSAIGQSSGSQVPPTITVTPDDNLGTLTVTVTTASGVTQSFNGSEAFGVISSTQVGPSIAVTNYSNRLTSGSASVSFGTTQLGIAQTQTIIVTNLGNAQLIIQPVTPPTGFSISNSFQSVQTLASGASARLVVQLDATVAGNLSSAITIQSNDSSVANFVVNLTGLVVVPQILLTLGATRLPNASGSVNFGSTLVGTPVTQSIVLKNTGTVPVTLASVALPDGFSIVDGIDFSTSPTIAVGASTTFTLQLDATSISTPSGTVTIFGPTSGLYTFGVSGIVNAPQIAVLQGATMLTNVSGLLDLTSTPVGTTLQRVITVTNTGTAPLIMQPVTVPAGFSVVPGTNFTANQSIAIGSSATFTLQFDSQSSGTAGGTVTIPNSDTTASPFKFQVTALATSATAAVLVIQPLATSQVSGGAMIGFDSLTATVAAAQTVPLVSGAGTIYFNITSASQPVLKTFNVVNRGNAPLIIQSITAPSGFSVVNDSATNHSISGIPGQFSIQLNPNATGTPNGLVKITVKDSPSASFTFKVAANHAPKGVTIVPSSKNHQNNPTSFLVATNPLNRVSLGAINTADDDSSTLQQTFIDRLQYSATSQFPLQIPLFMYRGVATPVFTVDGQGNFSLSTGAPNTVYDLLLTSTDQGGSTFSETIKFYVTGDAGPPVGSDAGRSTMHQLGSSTATTTAADSVYYMASGSPIGTTLTTFNVNPARIQNASGSSNSANSSTAKSLTRYQLAAGGDNSAFTIDANGNLKTLVALNAAVKSSYQISIITTDSVKGGSTIRPYTVRVVTLLSPTLIVSPATFHVNSSSVSGTVAGTVTVAGAGTQTPTFSITAGNQNGIFAIDPITGQITVANAAALNSAGRSSYRLTVQALDSNAAGFATVTINIAGPLKISLSNSSIAENASVGTVIGQLRTTEPGSGNTYQYVLVPGQANNARFTVDSIGNVKLNTTLNAALRNNYSIDVRSTDQHGLSIDQTLTISVLGPSHLSLSNSSVLANAAMGSVIGQFSTTGAGTGNTYQYSLLPGQHDDAAFAVDTSGHLLLKTGLNAAIRNSYTIDVMTTDQRGLSLIQQFTITVLGPSNITLSNSSILETAASGAMIGQFMTADAGTGNTFSYRLPSGDFDNANFLVDATGHLKLNTHLNKAIKNSYKIFLISTDQRGLAVGKAFTITVT